jgi:hypothetical protein
MISEEGRILITFPSVDVFIVVFGLVKQYASLKARTRALRAQSSEKDSDDVSAKAALKAEWGTWQEAALINL